MEAFYFGSPETSRLIRWALLTARKNKKITGTTSLKWLGSHRGPRVSATANDWVFKKKGDRAGKGPGVRVGSRHKKTPLWGSNAAVLLLTRWLSAFINRQCAVRQYRDSEGSKRSRLVINSIHIISFCRMLSNPRSFQHPCKFWKSS